VLIDLTHMSQRALADTFALLDELDPGRTVPLLFSHTAYRFGALQCNSSEEAIARMAERRGVIGLILADHHAGDGLRATPTATFEDSIAVVCGHIDRIHTITRSHDHVAIGSDLDGFIQPMAGLEDTGRFQDLGQALRARYGPDAAGRMCAGNALRVIRSAWTRGWSRR
jgi:microsomal dipeptidase-like Zn-dependent dipeptidase